MNKQHDDKGYAEDLNSHGFTEAIGVQKKREMDKMHQQEKYVDVVCITPSNEIIRSVTQNIHAKGVVLTIMQHDHDLKNNDVVKLQIKELHQGKTVLGKVTHVLNSVVMVEFMQEQREIDRISGEFIIKISLPNMHGLMLHTHDYSQSGLFFTLDRSIHQLKVGDELNIEMFLPEDLQKDQLCEVVRVESTGVAVNFK